MYAECRHTECLGAINTKTKDKICDFCQIFGDSLSPSTDPTRFPRQQSSPSGRRQTAGLFFRDRDFNFLAFLLHSLFLGKRGEN